MVSAPGRPVRAVAAARRRQVKLGAYVTFEGRPWQVAAVAGASVRLVDEDGQTASVLTSLLFADPTFAVVDCPVPAAAPWGLLEAVPERERERAMAWQRHIREIETGLPDGPGGTGCPRPEYDPQRTSMAEREQAKADELAALGWPRASRATVRRMRARYHTGGVMGLVRQRKPSSATGRADERVVAAVLEALRRQRGRSTGTLKGLRELSGQILAEAHGPGAVALPAPSTFNRLVRVLADPLEHPGRPARTATAVPVRPFTPVVALRPGELVQVDTTRLDIMAIGEDGKPVRPELTIALDVATRSVVAAVLREQSTQAVDAALLLAEMAVPHPARPGWGEHLRLAHAAVPYDRLLALDARLEQAAARPVVVPETIVIDRGRVFLSAAFLAACESLGVSVQPAPPRSPTAKGAVERTFGSINTLFAQHTAGYTGPHILARGEAVEDEARFTVAQMQELLDEWITACWQHRPHDGLRHPLLPKKALSPGEMWAALLGASGYVPLPLTGADYTELLPVRFHPVTGRGIRINYRTYDHAILNEHRGRSCPTGPGGKWEVHLNPHDVRQIYLRLPDGHLHEIPWIHRDHVQAPMSETTWRHIRTTLEQRAEREAHAAALAEAADQILRQARPTTPAPAAPATAPGTRAGKAVSQAAGGEPAAPHRTAAQAATEAEDSLDALDARAARDDVGADESGALTLPASGALTLYDADQEAELW
ncbi:MULTISPECIES: DDE-type integrase/transposase/recombinase [Streptomyces]|uniref:Transposase family protein n=1 Tax=Streptomyces siderophoricus TaxID=2802281 RepID=A0ABS1MRV7_9ACTN|nr:DDE-type integrase/transposase/recombinase [Streptomyces sp. 9-7]MBL1090483.1 transposase family protein [Streptomyces sp. 9-7]